MENNFTDPDDAPSFTGDEFDRPEARWRIGAKDVSPEEGKAAFRAVLRGKTRTNIHFDNDLIAYYKAKAGPRGYQTLINAAARKEMENSELRAELLQAIHAEFLAMRVSLLEEVGKLMKSLVSSQTLSYVQGNTPSDQNWIYFIGAESLTASAPHADLLQPPLEGMSSSRLILPSTPTQGTA